MQERIETIQADITTLDVTAVVNAANSSLLGGGGVDGAIHRAAGPGLLEECRQLNGCPTGEARLTAGHELTAAYVIHTVGPVWGGGNNDEDALLEACYRNSLQLVAEHDMDSVAFPAISTGVYRFPLERACGIALTTVDQFLQGNDRVRRVVFCCFSAGDLATYRRVRERLDI